MIRLARGHDVRCPTDIEAGIRIYALSQAYGDDDTVVRFYTDDNDTVMAVMDGAAVLYAPRGLNDEWLQFLSFVPEVHTLRTDADTGFAIAKVWSVPVKQGILMQYALEKPTMDATLSEVRLDDLYGLLCTCFSSMPPFGSWYVDISHRVRHGHCHISCLCHDNTLVSSAMTVAEADDAVLIGAVATHSSWRRQGLAGRCVLSLVERFYDRRVYIAPVDQTVAALYEKLGFSPCHTWAEITR